MRRATLLACALGDGRCAVQPDYLFSFGASAIDHEGGLPGGRLRGVPGPLALSYWWLGTRPSSCSKKNILIYSLSEKSWATVCSPRDTTPSMIRKGTYFVRLIPEATSGSPGAKNSEPSSGDVRFSPDYVRSSPTPDISAVCYESLLLTQAV